MLKLNPVFGLLLAAMLLASSPAAAGNDLRLPEGLSIGQISGPGHEQLEKALAKHTKKGAAAGLLSGRISLSSQTRAEKETVPLEKNSGKPYYEFKPDPFTGRMWKEKQQPTQTVLKNYDLERYNGLMTFDWQLHAADGALLKEGSLTLDLERSRGGYLAAEGLASSLRGGGEKAERRFDARLAEETVRLLTLDLGRHVSASELESAGDSWSRKAKSLAKKGDWNGAKDLWLELLTQNPNYGPALYNMGVYWEHENNPQSALEYYRKAFASDGSIFHRRTLNRLTETLLKAKRLPES